MLPILIPLFTLLMVTLIKVYIYIERERTLERTCASLNYNVNNISIATNNNTEPLDDFFLFQFRLIPILSNNYYISQ